MTRFFTNNPIAILGILGFLALLSGACDDGNIEKGFGEKPNIILILTDDLGYGDFGFTGNKLIQTPNLDKLFTESIFFSDFHVATSCAPTRAGLLTGIHCNRTGTWHTINGRSFLSTRFPTLAEMLKETGYNTGIFGKWHLGDNYPFRPQDRGFEEVLIHGGGGVGQTPDFWNNDYYGDTYLHNGKPKKFEGYCTDIWFDEAIKYINSATASDQPFFCYISTNSAHSPHHVPNKYIDPYKNNPEVPNPNFYGQITNIDENLGKLEQALENSKLGDNTLVVFLSDNGTAGGAKMDNKQQVVKGYNAGLRGKKVSEYEGGHRVPLSIRFPKSWQIEKQEFSQLTNYTDVVPTLLDILKVPTINKFDGESLLPLITTGQQVTLENRILITDTQRKEFPKKWKNSCVMYNKWRLINNKELYNLETDLNQDENIISGHPKIAKQLSQAYENWWDNIQVDIKEDNLIIIGSQKANPVLLTCHDWHSEEAPPWHQRHIRSARNSNGHWLLEVEQAGTYSIKLYRWPPESGLALLAELAVGEQVEGGEPYLPGKKINIESAKVEIQGKIVESQDSKTVTHFKFQIPLEKGKADLKTWLFDHKGTSQGAYYVELERL